MAESLLTLLCAVYMMEQRSLDALKEKAAAAHDMDTLIRVRTNIVETRWQISLLRACLELQGVDSPAQDQRACLLAGKIDISSLSALKRFEIDLYKKLIAAARAQHAPEVLQACREILEQERAMMEWIEDNHRGTELKAAVGR